MSVRLRVGAAADHETAVAVWRASNTARRNGVPSPAEHEERVRSRFGQPDVWLLVAEDAGEVVGITSGMPARADDGAGDVVVGLCHLSLVFVLPHRWGEGVGGLLVDGALEEARARGFDRIQLWTHEDNARSRPLYASRGFLPEWLTKDDDLGERIGIWSRDL